MYIVFGCSNAYFKHDYMYIYLQSSTEAVLAAEFHPCDKVIVSCGKSLLAFWSYDGDTLSKKTAIFEVKKFKNIF